MAGGLEAISDIGAYSQATFVYSGLVVESLVKRGGGAVVDCAKCSGKAIADCTKASANAVVEAGEYSLATLEYAGLVSASIVKRSGAAVGACARMAAAPVGKVVSPVARGVAKPFALLADKTGKVFKLKKKASEDALKNLETKVQGLESLADTVFKLEERIAAMEKYGVRAAVTTAPVREKKDLSENRRAFLRAIVEENKLLRAAA